MSIKRITGVQRQDRLIGGVDNNIYARAQDVNPIIDFANSFTHTVAGAIIATNVSTTIDFGSLKVGDIVLSTPAAAGNSEFEIVVTNGTKPSAAVVGDLYSVLRANA